MIGQPPLKLDFRCATCGYGVARLPPPERCPMCAGGRWEQHPKLHVAGGLRFDAAVVVGSMPAPVRVSRAQAASEAGRRPA